MKTRIASTKESLNLRSVYIFLESRLYLVSGQWEWDLHSDELFCSDVMFPLGRSYEFSGTVGLIHPEDVPLVKAQLENIRQHRSGSAGFRIITTYGQVLPVGASGLLELSEDADFADAMRRSQLRHFIEERMFREECDSTALQVQAYQYAERINGTGIWTVNTITHEAFYSDGIYRIHGLPPQSLNPHLHTFAVFIHPEDRDVVVSLLEKAYKEQVPVHVQYRLLLNHTEHRHVQLSTRWRFSPKGEPVVVGVLEDISEKVAAEQEAALLKKERLLKAQILNHAEGMNRMANWHINLLTRKIEYSDQLYHIYGLKPPTPLNYSLLLKYVHPEDRDRMMEVNRKIFYENTAPDIEYRIMRPDGKIRYLRQKGKIVINTDEEMIMIGTIVDITDHELSESRLRLTRTELQVQQFSYSHVEEMAGIGNWIWDINTGEIAWSKGLYELLGHKPHSIQLSQRVLLNFIHPDDKLLFTECLGLLLHGSTDESCAFRMIRKGHTRYMQARFKLVILEDQVVFIGTVQDRTTETELQQQLAEQVAMAELLTDASPDRVVVTDTNHYILKWNRTSEEDFGIKREKAIGKNLYDVLPALKTPEIMERMLRVIRGEHLYLKDQKSAAGPGFYDMLLAPVKDMANNTLAVLTMMRDTTQQHELRQQLTQRLQFIEKLLEATVDRIIVLDRNMNFLYWNKRAEEYFELKKEYVSGKNVLEVFPAFINDPSYDEFRRALKGDTIYIPPVKSRAEANGYFETYLIPIKDEKKEVTGVLWMAHNLAREMNGPEQDGRS